MSYSWYVVHWPVILILTADRTGLDSWLLVAVKVVASGLVAVALHLSIEQPLRRREWPVRTTFGAWIGASVGVVGLAVLVL